MKEIVQIIHIIYTHQTHRPNKRSSHVYFAKFSIIRSSSYHKITTIHVDIDVNITMSKIQIINSEVNQVELPKKIKI